MRIVCQIIGVRAWHALHLLRFQKAQGLTFPYLIALKAQRELVSALEQERDIVPPLLSSLEARHTDCQTEGKYGGHLDR